MEISESFLALIKLILVFPLILLLLRLRMPLWLAIVAGAVAVALSCGVAPTDWPGIIFAVVRQRDFLLLILMVFLILLLSSVQEAAGQSRLLVQGLEQHLRRPRLRLVFFPALIGLLPMPGGALFSCPMIKAAAGDMGVSEQKKAVINVWFRHIWELAWPLYPGYVLACSFLGIPLYRLCQFTFPIVPLAFAVGWFFLMRDLRPASPEAQTDDRADQDHDDAQTDGAFPDPASQQAPCAPGRIQSLPETLLHSLPIAVTLIGAIFFSLLFGVFLPNAPGPLGFSMALFCAICVALWQGRKRMRRSFVSLVFSANTRKMMLLLFVIYTFKETIAVSGLIRSLGEFGDSAPMVVLSFVLLPFIGGMLTGVMFGFVGISFPILLGVLAHSPLREYALPLAILGLIAGNAGQLLSPLHICLVVTSEFFTTPIPGILRRFVAPVLTLFAGSVLWVLIIAAMGVRL